MGLHGESWEGGGADVPLTSDEVQVIQGALDLALKTASEAMTPSDKVQCGQASAGEQHMASHCSSGGRS